MIILDDRGNSPKYLEAKLPGLTNTPVHITRLLEGDIYWEGQEQCWGELKSADDLVTSLKSGHMQDQEARMLELPGRKFLFVEGELRAGYRGETYAEVKAASPQITVTGWKATTHMFRKFRKHEFPYSAVMNYLARLQDFGFVVLHAAGPFELVGVIAATYKRSLKDGPARVVRQKASALDPRVAAANSLYPGVPYKALESLVNNYWRDPICIPEDVKIKDLTNLPGVGRTTVRKVTGR